MIIDKNALKEIGCPARVIAAIEKENSWERRIIILKGYRKELLESVHIEQQKLQNLDYLIFQARKEKQ